MIEDVRLRDAQRKIGELSMEATSWARCWSVRGALSRRGARSERAAACTAEDGVRGGGLCVSFGGLHLGAGTPASGPVGSTSDRELSLQIRGVLADSPFVGEGHRKVWARLRRVYVA